MKKIIALIAMLSVAFLASCTKEEVITEEAAVVETPVVEVLEGAEEMVEKAMDEVAEEMTEEATHAVEAATEMTEKVMEEAAAAVEATEKMVK